MPLNALSFGMPWLLTVSSENGSLLYDKTFASIDIGNSAACGSQLYLPLSTNIVTKSGTRVINSESQKKKKKKGEDDTEEGGR